jgi:hypothetical protein
LYCDLFGQIFKFSYDLSIADSSYLFIDTEIFGSAHILVHTKEMFVHIGEINLLEIDCIENVFSIFLSLTKIVKKF